MLNGFVVGDGKVVAKFDGMSAEVQAALKQGIGRAVLLVQVRAKQKLSDQVLHVRSGRLRRSINTRVTESPGHVAGIVGTNVRYAAIHEYGFEGAVTVREHLRRTKTGKQLPVRTHSREVSMPKRSFLRSSMEEMELDIAKEIAASVKKLFKQP